MSLIESTLDRPVELGGLDITLFVLALAVSGKFDSTKISSIEDPQS